MEKRILQLALAFIAILFVWRIWDPLWTWDLNDAVNPRSEDKIVFSVNKGESAKAIAFGLEEEKLIVSKKSFLRFLEKEELDTQLHYGKFVLRQNMTLEEIANILTSTGTGEMAVRVIEGWTIDEIDAELAEMGLISPGEFRRCTFNCDFDYDFLDASREEGNISLEGFLFPDTYFIDSSDFSSEALINLMLSTFDQRFDDDMEAAMKAQGRSWSEMIKIASMIEKEVRTEEDIPMVGDIIWRRYDENWQLGIDATMLYVQDDNVITAEDLRMDSPYNTRNRTGLPPTAIANPGLASLKGAVYPTANNYWFYLTTLDTGEVIYAKTNAEHEANKDKYL